MAGGISDGLHVEEHGNLDGPLVALVHGTMDRAAGMAKVARRLHDRYRVLRYDRRGYAHSRHAGGPYGMEQQVDDLVRLLAGRPAVVVGHSYGGDVALATAAWAPAVVRAVAAYEPPMPWLPFYPDGTAGRAAVNAGQDEEPGAAAEAFLRRMIGDDRWNLLPGGTKAERMAEGEALVGEIADLRARVPFEPSWITAPALAGCGDQGRPHHQQTARWLAEHLPDGELMVLAGVGHGVHLSEPGVFAGFVERAVARAGP